MPKFEPGMSKVKGLSSLVEDSPLTIEVADEGGVSAPPAGEVAVSEVGAARDEQTTPTDAGEDVAPNL